MEKLCSVCGIMKDYSEYAKKSSSPIGIRSECKQCSKEYQARVKERRAEWSRQYYEKNSEKIRAVSEECRNKRIAADIGKARELYRKAYYRNIEYHKKRYVENKEVIRAKNKIWVRSPDGKASRINSEAKRRGLMYSTGHSSAIEAIKLLKKYSTTCYYCGENIDTLHIDHYVPLCKGGKHEATNLVASCSSCNLRKGGKMPIDFIRGDTKWAS